MLTDFKVEFEGKEYPCLYVTTKQKAEQVIEFLKTKPGVLAADLETGALSKYRNVPKAALSPHMASPRLLQFFTGMGSIVIDLWRTGPIDLKSLFESRPSVFHNMTFDYKMLRQHYGVETPDMHCTAIMARCVFHAIYAQDFVGADLGNVVKIVLRQELNKKAGRSDWSLPDLTFEQIHYAAKDTITLMRIYERLSDSIDKLGLRKVYDLYRKAQLVLSGAELTGITFDHEQHRKNVVHWRQELADAEDEVKRITGLTKITDGEVAKWLDATLPEYEKSVWPRTERTTTGKGGKLQTNADAFVMFSHLDIVKPLTKYKKLMKLTTSFGMNLINQVNPATGKLHPTYRIAGAKTGRLSCSDGNIQQMPRVPKDDKSPNIRAAFVPSKGYTMVVADYSQVEVRYIAELSQDEKMLHAFEEGMDIYAYTAAHLNGIDISEVTKEQRQQSKALVLGLNYGLGYKKFAHYAKKGYNVDISEGDSFNLVNDYRNLYTGLREWQLQQVSACEVNRYIAKTVMGKTRKMYEDGYFCACMNHPVQGGCAEIMLLAIVKAHENFKGTTARILASVHDELIVECKPEEVEAVKDKLKSAMIDAYKEIVPNARTLRNLVEPTSGDNWAEAKG